MIIKAQSKRILFIFFPFLNINNWSIKQIVDTIKETQACYYIAGVKYK